MVVVRLNDCKHGINVPSSKSLTWMVERFGVCMYVGLYDLSLSGGELWAVVCCRNLFHVRDANQRDLGFSDDVSPVCVPSGANTRWSHLHPGTTMGQYSNVSVNQYTSFSSLLFHVTFTHQTDPVNIFSLHHGLLWIKTDSKKTLLSHHSYKEKLDSELAYSEVWALNERAVN